MNEYDFATFQVGKANKLAFMAAEAVAESLAGLYNPLFIYGRSGLGKTHLLKAIETYVKAANPHAITLYSKCAALVESLVKAQKNKSADSFMRSFQSIDLLLLDDMHVLLGKMATQSKIREIIELCVNSGHQVVLSSTEEPVGSPVIDWSMRHTFDKGLYADIQRPDAELIKKVVIQKSKHAGLDLSDSQVDLIARLDFDNIRLIEGLINWIAANAASGPVVSSSLINDALEYMRIYCRQEKARLFLGK
ncbi:MAG: ATP-binding protein [Oscillospiraceae bacterium]|nr:ATP-binding protein [Oscillospiraceae bacterium]